MDDQQIKLEDAFMSRMLLATEEAYQLTYSLAVVKLSFLALDAGVGSVDALSYDQVEEVLNEVFELFVIPALVFIDSSSEATPPLEGQGSLDAAIKESRTLFVSTAHERIVS